MQQAAIGTDAEFFLVDPEGFPISSEGLIGGGKGRPVKCKGGGYLEDCVAVEINTNPVPLSGDWEDFAANIYSCIEAASVVTEPLDFTPSIVPEHIFGSHQLTSMQANISGCAESFDAWLLKKNRPVDLTASNKRFASGDIHLSWEGHDDGRFAKVNAVRLLDMTVGMYEVIHSKKSDRTSSYGRPGMHRPKKYGVEYKTPSNFWITSDNHIKNIFNLCSQVIALVNTLDNSRPYYEDYYPMVRSIRDAWDVYEAAGLMTSLGFNGRT